MGDDTLSLTDKIPNTDPAANNIVQDTESATANKMVEDNKAEVIEDPVAIDVLQNDDEITNNAEDPETVDKDTNNANDPETVDEDTNKAHDENAEVEADNMTSEENFDDHYGIRTSHYNLRRRKGGDYSHLQTMVEVIAMTQYPEHKGIKEFGYASKRAVIEELQQLHERQVIEPCNAEKMSKTERLDALEYLMFLKKMQSGTIKGSQCADGYRQCPRTKKEDDHAPTVALEALMLSCIIDAIIDIPGAFVQAVMDKEVVHMCLHRKMAKLLVQLDTHVRRCCTFSEEPIFD